MKVDFNELFKKRWSLGRRFNEESNLVEDEMVEAAVSEGNNEFAVILCPNALKCLKCECKFPSLRNFFVTVIYNLWRWNYYNEMKETDNPYDGDTLEYSLITFSKEQPKQ